MKLEAGKRYVLRDGRVTEPMQYESARVDLPWFAMVGIEPVRWASDTGEWYLCDAKSQYDCITEYVEEAAPVTGLSGTVKEITTDADGSRILVIRVKREDLKAYPHNLIDRVVDIKERA